MRIANYRDDVLWAIAYKMGLDPAKEFLTDEGTSLDSYINAWVRRTWDTTDNPEWTTIKEFVPDVNHQVPYNALPLDGSPPVVLSRPLKVYLVDPRVTPYPIDTRFRVWDEGLHVGFDHGVTVWIKYLGPPPKFTSVPWNSVTTYRKGNLVYSPASGQCYLSKSGANLGNDPTGQQGVDPAPLTVELIQAAAPEQPEIIGRTQITKITQHTELLDTDQTRHTWDILDGTGAVVGSATYLAPLGAAPADILTAIYNSLDANVALSAFTFTLDTTNLSIQIEANQFFAVRSYYYSSPPLPEDTVMTGAPADPTELVYGDDAEIVTVGPYPLPPTHTVYNTINNLQYYVAAVAFAPAKAQIIQLTMSAQSAIPRAAYELDFTDVGAELHVAEFINNPGRSSLAILQGIVAVIEASTDPFFNAMSTSIDPIALTLKFASYDLVSLNAEIVPMGSAWWEPVLFPLALVEPVVRGAYADALREAGQTDKAMAEEQITVQEQGDRVTKALAPGYNPLTDQLAPANRYRAKVPAQGAGK
jgi:hypothetical protein